MSKLWLNERQFIEVAKNAPDGRIDGTEIAVRSRSIDWAGLYWGYLPDPDPVLQKLGNSLDVYRQLLSDAHVWSCYDSRKSGTLCDEWEIGEPGEDEDRRAFDDITEIMKRIDVYQIITDMLDAPFFGMSPIEIVWQATDGKWVPIKIEGKPPEWFVFGQENDLRFLSVDNQLEGEKLPAKRFLLPRHHASYQNPYGERVLAKCFWPVAFKRGGFKFWAIFTEKYGMPWITGKVPRQTNETERDALLAKLVSMVQDAVAVINDDESIEITEAEGKTASADIYQALINSCNREISKAILGQTLSTELDQGGSYAATEGHLEVRQDIVDKDKRMVKAAFNTLFQWYDELNYAGAIAPEFGFYEEEDVQKDLADRDKILTEQGVRFRPSYYQKAYNLEEEDFEVREPSQGPQPSFAETLNTAQDRLSHDTADTIAKEAAASSQRAISALLQPVLKAVGDATTFEEIGESIYKLYPDMDTELFQELLTRAMAASAAVGYGASAGEAGE